MVDWTFNDKLFENVLEEFNSFVYIIERLNVVEDSKSPIYYVGKKIFMSKTKYKSKRILEESDWWNYYGSSDWLSEDIEKYGKHNFKRTILHLCRTKGDAGYLEAKEQIERNVLSIDTNGYKLYYNKNILGRYRIEPEHYVLTGNLEKYHHSDCINSKNRRITNGVTNRIVSNKIADDLTSSGKWSDGWCEKTKTTNANTTHSHIKNSPSKTKVSVLDGNVIKWVLKCDESDFTQITETTELPLFFVNNGITQVHFENESDKDVFLNENTDYSNGRFDKLIGSGELVMVKNVRSGERLLVERNEFASNKELISLSSKKVKIKMKNRIIFKGFLEAFVIDNPSYKITKLKKMLKTSETCDGLSVSFL